MLRTLYKACSYLIVALGTTHLIFTFFNYDQISLDAFWFAGSGFAIIFAGFLNLSLIKVNERTVRVLCILANLICTALFAVALPLLRQPQVLVGLLLFAFATAAAFAARKGLDL